MKEVKAAEALPTRVGVKLFALVMALVLALSMTAAPVSAYAVNTSDDGEVTVDKTATDLDENDQTDVTLSIGSTQESYGSDVVFVLDKSTSNEVKEEALAMLDELMDRLDDDAVSSIKVGLVTFNATANNAGFNMELTELNEDSYNTLKSIFEQALSSGTNIEAGIRAGMEMLEGDSSVPDSNKHLVLVTDGITYMWGTGDTAQTVYLETNNHAAVSGPDNVLENRESILDVCVNVNDYSNASAWLAYAADELDIENIIETYQTDYVGSLLSSVDSVGSYISYSEDDPSAVSSLECAIYKTGLAWQDAAAAGYKLYAYTSVNDSYPWASKFIGSLNTISGTSLVYSDDAVEGMFDEVRDSILYEIQSGTVTDVIGADFDLAGLDTFTLTVGETTYEGTVDESANTVTFDGGNYVVTYYPDGENGEYFTWEINVPVESANPVQLTYTLTLVNKSEVAGEHTAATNESAELEYEGTDGKTGTVEFPVPTVDYTVEEAEPSTTTDSGDDEGTTLESTSSDTQTDTSTGTLPKTGDSSLSLVVGLTALALASLAAVIFALVRLRATKLTDMLTRH